MSSFYLGKRLSTKGQRCTVRYIGPVAGKQGQWLGVEWDDATRGKHSGTHQGVEYFKCKVMIVLLLSTCIVFFVGLRESAFQLR
jgi:dynactin complex subunit